MNNIRIVKLQYHQRLISKYNLNTRVMRTSIFQMRNGMSKVKINLRTSKILIYGKNYSQISLFTKKPNVVFIHYFYLKK